MNGIRLLRGLRPHKMRKVSEAADNYLHIMLGQKSHRVRHSVDCASILGRYSHEGSSIRLAGLHPTLMALPDRFQAGENDFEGALVGGPETVSNPPFALWNGSQSIP
jgi:hypothetical protein